MKIGWETKKIGEICDLMTGGTPSRSHPEYFSNGSIKWLVSGDIHKGEIFDCEGRITEAGFKSSNAKFLPLNSVLIALNGQGKTRGTVALLRTLATCNQSLVSISPRNPLQLLPEFLFYNLHGRYEEIRKLTSDADNDRRGLNMPIIRNIEVSFPPLPEQQRIVRILDEAFTGIAVARANAEKNLQNAREVFESFLDQVFKQHKENWNIESLNMIANISYGYTESASNELIGPKFLRITDIQNNAVNWKNVPYCKIAADNLKKHRLLDGDIVFARTGATTGKSYLVSDPPLAVFASYLIRVQLTNKNILPAFVYLYFQSNNYWEAIRSGISGSAQGGFNATKLGDLLIPYPNSQNEQLDIISKVNFLNNAINDLLAITQKKITALDEFKQSLLHQAFSGEL